MKERPILFNGAMVKAILDGRKTVTRRVIKPQPMFSPEAYDRVASWIWRGYTIGAECDEFWKTEALKHCPYGAPGDRLWVRETWRSGGAYPDNGQVTVEYAAGGPFQAHPTDDWARFFEADNRWRPSIHMPRWASRITLEVTSVSVERVQDITEEQAKSEGAEPKIGLPGDQTSYVAGFYWLWNSINAKRGYGWNSNPWVWAVEFRRVEP